MVRSIVGMEHRRPAGALRLLQGKIEIGQPTLIEEIAIAVRQVGPEEYRCVVDNGTQLVFRLRGLCFYHAVSALVGSRRAGLHRDERRSVSDGHSPKADR